MGLGISTACRSRNTQILNLFKPSGNYVHHQILTFTNSAFCPQCIYMFCMDLRRTNSDYFPIQKWLTGFYNRDGMCLLRGTDWVYVYNWGYSQSLKGSRVYYVYMQSDMSRTQSVLEGCLTVHLPHEIIWNANLMQQGNFINVFWARHVSGTYAHHQEH